MWTYRTVSGSLNLHLLVFLLVFQTTQVTPCGLDAITWNNNLCINANFVEFPDKITMCNILLYISRDLPITAVDPTTGYTSYPGKQQTSNIWSALHLFDISWFKNYNSESHYRGQSDLTIECFLSLVSYTSHPQWSLLFSSIAMAMTRDTPTCLSDWQCSF